MCECINRTSVGNWGECIAVMLTIARLRPFSVDFLRVCCEELWGGR